MKTVAHRGWWTDSSSQNTLESLLAAMKQGFAVETDIRLHKGEIVLSHDPLGGDTPATLENLLRQSQGRYENFLFLNVKEDGLLPHLERQSVWLRHPVVFFDMSVPELVKYTRAVPSENLATRWSDLESEPVLYDRCDWIWADCFDSALNLSLSSARKILSDKKTVFVSPQLHGRNPAAFLTDLDLLEKELGKEFLVCQDVFPSSVLPSSKEMI